MLIRISLIIAIIASLAAAGISFVKVKEKIETLKSERDEWHGKFDITDKELTDKKKELAGTKKDLDKTKTELATTTAERDQFQKAATEAQAKATELADKLTKTTDDLTTAQQKLTQWDLIGLNVDQVKKAIADAKAISQDRTNLVRTLTLLGRELTVATNKLDQLTGFDREVLLPPELRGKVVVVDPKYDFVVLDVGENKGVKENGILLVNRNGKLVAKVKVRSVQQDRAIANIIPGWKLGEVMEGDLVLPGI